MPRLVSDVPAITATGIVSALAAIGLDGVVPEGRLKGLLVLGIGIAASVAWFEITTRYVAFRLRRDCQGLERVLSEFDRYQEAFARRVEANIRDARDRDASRKEVLDMQEELKKFRRINTDLLARFRGRVEALLSQLPD
jgi:hypothetical protein